MPREHNRDQVEIEDDTDRAQTARGREQTPQEKVASLDRFMDRLTTEQPPTTQ